MIRYRPARTVPGTKRPSSSESDEESRPFTEVIVGATEIRSTAAPHVGQNRPDPWTSLAQEGQITRTRSPEDHSRPHRAEIDRQIGQAPREGDQLRDLDLLVRLMVGRLVAARPADGLDAERVNEVL